MIKNIFVNNWQRKIVAILSAVLIWLVVHNAITTTRVFTNVSVRVVNLPQDKTIRGLMPNGILDKKIQVTLTGTKHVIDKIEPGDFEVVLDAFGKSDQWIVQLAKRNLVSLNPDIDLIHNVTEISQNEFVIPLSNLMTAKIPVYVMPPKGEPPEGFQYLDVFPGKLTHVVSGPEADVKELQAKGLELTFDLSKIHASDLKQLVQQGKDEVSFYVPESWRKVAISFYNDLPQEINGPEAKHLHIDFLQKELLPLSVPLPITLFYPQEYISSVNPTSHPLLASDVLKEEYGIYTLKGPLFVGHVSRLFLEIVKANLELCIVAHPTDNDVKLPLRNFLDFIDPNSLEDKYVKQFDFSGATFSQKEEYIRDRFRSYMRSITLFIDEKRPLDLKAFLQSSGVKVVSAENDQSTSTQNHSLRAAGVEESRQEGSKEGVQKHTQEHVQEHVFEYDKK